MQNPFKPGNGIEPPYLAGRAAVLKKFDESLGEFEQGLPRNLMVFGLRGTGKTVMMKHFAAIARGRGWLVATREFNRRFCDEARFAEAVAGDIVEKASERSLAVKLQKYGRKILDQAKPSEISIRGITYKPFYEAKKGLLEDYLKDMLVSNWGAIRGSGAKGLVFLYDEFHSVRDGDVPGNYPLASLLGALSYAQRNGCKYYLAVSGLPNLPANLKDAKTYTERMFIFQEMENLPMDDAEKAIRIPVKEAGHLFEEKLVGEIARETCGYPYFLQFYCYYLIKSVAGGRITLANYRKIRNGMLGELDLGFYEDRLQKATHLEAEVLEAMAKVGNGTISPMQIMKTMRIEKSVLFAYLRSLMGKNLVYKSGRGSYAFTVPMFREFLVRHRRKHGRAFGVE